VVSLTDISKYKCISCGYSAKVYDGQAETFYAYVETKHCLGCKSLIETPVKLKAEAYIGGDSDIKLNLVINECPECCGTNVQHWNISDGCPRCGEHMTRFEAI
jgi:hypothetical protein